MAGVPVKFRCYRCNQLLGVSRSKVGAIVACPKCAAELVVPEPVEPASASITAGGAGSTDAESPASTPTNGGRAPGLDVGLSLDFLDIRPEDIRVEPGFPGAFTRESDEFEPEPTVSDAPTETVSEAEHSTVPDPTTPLPSDAPPVETILSPTIAPTPTVPVPPIQLDAPLKRAGRRAAPQPVPVRARDLVLPRSVVGAWSLFVILALALAFLAGLLAGHYVWRVH